MKTYDPRANDSDAQRDQRPSSGCWTCGGPVRTWKSGGWHCSECVKAGRVPR